MDGLDGFVMPIMPPGRGGDGFATAQPIQMSRESVIIIVVVFMIARGEFILLEA
jgi:hypothetical protein